MDPKEINVHFFSLISMFASVYEFFMNQKPPMNSVAIDYLGKRITYREVIEKSKKRTI